MLLAHNESGQSICQKTRIGTRGGLMPASFQPRLDILPESQRLLWPELDAVPSDFVLYGGTALALQLGHRVSEDFDFFSSSGFDPHRLRSRLPFFRDLDPSNTDAWVHRKRDNLEAFVDRGGLVKVAFFGGLDMLNRVEDPRRAAGSRVQVACLIVAGVCARRIGEAAVILPACSRAATPPEERALGKALVLTESAVNS